MRIDLSFSIVVLLLSSACGSEIGAGSEVAPRPETGAASDTAASPPDDPEPEEPPVEPPTDAATIEAAAEAGPAETGAADAPPESSNPSPDGGGTGPFSEQGGLVVVEVESAKVSDQWTERTSVAGASGKYYEWRSGDTSLSFDAAGKGLLEYALRITKTGRYHLAIRSAAPHPTDHNDVWVRSPDLAPIRVKGAVEEGLGLTWFKVYQNASNDQWTWITRTKDHDGHDIYLDITKPGTYRVQLSGRSTQFKIDRFVLRHVDVPLETATSLDRMPSPRS
jgi:hypothetical protein